MDYHIHLTNHERRVIFNLPPPFSTLWCKDILYQRSIELCFLCYLRSKDQWMIDIESVLFEHLDTEYSIDIPEDQLDVLINTVNNILYQLHSLHAGFNRAVQDVVGYFHPNTYDYIEVICSKYQPDIEIIVHAKDVFND